MSRREAGHMVETVGTDPWYGRQLFFCELDRLEDWPHTFGERDAHFVLFLALDAIEESNQALHGFATRVARQGLAYLCAWGPDCERVHDLFDDVREGEQRFFMTTWHDDESLDEALYFALFNSIPDEQHIESCRSVLSISVGRPEWAAEIRRRLANPSALISEVLAADSEGQSNAAPAFTRRLIRVAERLRRR